MNPLVKFGVFVALAGILSALFALFPERRPGCASPHLPVPLPIEEATAPSVPDAPASESGQNHRTPSTRPLSPGGARVAAA